MSIGGVVQVNGLFEDIPVLAALANAWQWTAFEILIWLLPFVLLLLAPTLFPKRAVRWLERGKAWFLVAFWMAWSCWLFPVGMNAWSFYLLTQGVICQFIPNWAWPWPIATFLAIPLGFLHWHLARRHPQAFFQGGFPFLFCLVVSGGMWFAINVAHAAWMNSPHGSIVAPEEVKPVASF